MNITIIIADAHTSAQRELGLKNFRKNLAHDEILDIAFLAIFDMLKKTLGTFLYPVLC